MFKCSTRNRFGLFRPIFPSPRGSNAIFAPNKWYFSCRLRLYIPIRFNHTSNRKRIHIALNLFRFTPQLMIFLMHFIECYTYSAVRIEIVCGRKGIIIVFHMQYKCLLRELWKHLYVLLSIRCFRAQLPRDNPFYPSCMENESDPTSAHLLASTPPPVPLCPCCGYSRFHYCSVHTSRMHSY